MAGSAKLANAAQNWANAMRSAQTKANYIAGVNAVTVSPTSLAASPVAQQRYLTGTQNAVQSGYMAKKLNAVSLQSWQASASGMGATNLSNAATKGAAKVAANFQANAQVYMNASAAAAAIPADGTIATAVAKVQASITAMKQGFGKAT